MGRGKKPGESVKNRAVKSNKFSSQRTKKKLKITKTKIGYQQNKLQLQQHQELIW